MGYEMIIIILMLVFNAIFAAYEIGLTSITRSRIHMLKENNKKGADDALFMKTRIEGSLATIQLGITLVAAIAAATGGAAVEEKFAPYIQKILNVSEPFSEVIALAVLIIPLSLITIIFAELVPKIIALNNREWIVLKLSPAMKFLFTVLSPIIVIIEKIVKKLASFGTKQINPETQPQKTESLHELRVAASFARASRILGIREERIILSAMQLSSRMARDITIPAVDISMLYDGSSISDAFIKAHLDMHTRFPVTADDNNPQGIFGYVNFKDILSAMKVTPSEPIVKTITRPIKTINPAIQLSSLLELMIQQKIHIVLVVDDKQVLGMVTLEDILEELVGDIEDEYDYIPDYIQQYGSSWIIGGRALTNVVASTVGLDWSNKFGEYIPTLTEWCTQNLGHSPKGGEIIEKDSLRVMPRKFRRNKMAEAVVSTTCKKTYN